MTEGTSLLELLRLCGLSVEALAGPIADPIVTSVVEDSRKISPGALFCCVKGRRFDGHDHAWAAVGAGAVALVVERKLDVAVPQAVVQDVRALIGPLALTVKGFPQERLMIAGVTGTNGKTTVSRMLASILAAAGHSPDVVGTLSGDFTTPPAADLASILASSRGRGADVVVMEVSSHALEQRRVEGLRFEVGVFTNLSQDHLDYHGSMERYYLAKRQLFEGCRTRTAVICSDDRWGRRLACERRREMRRYSLNDAEVLSANARSSRFLWRGLDVCLPLGGMVNVSNAVAAGEAALSLGVVASAIREGLEAVPALPGRFEVVSVEGFTVIVDFAHTPGSLTALLRSARSLLTPGARLSVVFGCGGDRYEGKRAEMGRLAADLSDRVFVTTDNPRSEDPSQIAEAILRGAREAAGTAEIKLELDRRKAIWAALESAAEGEIVLIAGKGHETTQVTAAGRQRFSDREVAAEALHAGGRG